MALTDETNNGMIMPVQPMYGGGCGSNGFGGFGGDWSAIIILFLFATMFGGFGGGWGGGFGGGFGESGFPWLLASNANNQNATNAGFGQAAVTGQLSGIQNSITTGFSNAEVANCNRAIDQIQSAHAGQIAALERSFAEQTANTQAINGISTQLANCCCENRLATVNLSALVQSENCADRAALSDGLRDVITNQTAGVQRILDKLCDQELQAERRENDNLRTPLNMANLAASQTAQTARLLADNANQTQAIENYIRPQINPAYIVPNPYAYNFYPWNGNGNGCGCNTCGCSGSF